MYKFGGGIENLACLFAFLSPALPYLTYKHLNTDTNVALCKTSSCSSKDCQVKFLKMISLVGTAAVLVSTALA